MRIFEECLVDIYQQLENLKKGTHQQEAVLSKNTNTNTNTNTKYTCDTGQTRNKLLE